MRDPVDPLSADAWAGLTQKLPEFVSGNIFVRPNVGKRGGVVETHTHHFDHTTIVFRGAIRVQATTPDGREIDKVFTAPSYFLVRAGVAHRLTFVDDGEFWCIYAHRDPQGRVTQTYDGFDEAYR